MKQQPPTEAPAGTPPGPNQAGAPPPGYYQAGALPPLPGYYQAGAPQGYYVAGTPPVYYQAVAPQQHPHPVGVPPLQPLPQVYPQPVGYNLPQGHWSTGLCDCFEDAPTCCITLWCPCITFGQTSEIIDRGTSSCGTNGVLYTVIALLTGLHCIYTCMYRSKMKLQYGMPQNNLDDFCIHCWCHYCALCQEHRELERRGYQVALGWHGNMEKMNRGMGVTTPPIVQGGMTR
ncbi:protein PLANT CADMIUM RESISTANCE 2-like [Silene latifolia]|uniref:protein PLANT CADMIUM RESISTANCE 2-like n=1 Tax=Silene latifolia TaxID=37657 RepID=UPI003D77B1E2